MAKWKDVQRVALPWGHTDDEYRTVVRVGYVVIQRLEDEWVDITDSCIPEFKWSMPYPSLRYIILKDTTKNQSRIAVMFHPDKKPEVTSGYKIERDIGLGYSFKVFKKED